MRTVFVGLYCNDFIGHYTILTEAMHPVMAFISLLFLSVAFLDFLKRGNGNFMLRTVSQFLNNNQILGKIIPTLQRLQHIDSIFKTVVNLQLCEHCSVLKLEANAILIGVESPVWATKLHYSIPEILKNLRTQPEFKSITKINYVIVKDATQPFLQGAFHKKPLIISKQNAEMLRITANQVTNERLKKGLLRIASHSSSLG